jgi:predicted Zn finger-like uncharacterized protein
MNLITRCPACGTTFRVQRDQLAAHFGTVRCGKCGSVFNGVAALVEQGAEKLSLDPSPQLGLFDPSRRPAQSLAGARDDAPLPEFLTDERPARPRLWLWLPLSILALAALGAQAYRVRTEATVWLPALRPALEALCRVAGCGVPLPRRPELLRIVSSDMHDDPARQVFVLNALLRNTGRFAQQYPDLELSLTNGDKVVTRRVLQPTEYLDPRSASGRVRTGLEAGAEEPLRVHVDAKIVRATGYELCIYPEDCLKYAKK